MMAWRLAIWPTRISPPLANATIDGQRLPPSAVGMTTGLPAWTAATTELVVPKSMPTILAMGDPPLMRWGMPALAGVFELGELRECLFRRARQYESVLLLAELLRRDRYQSSPEAKEAPDRHDGE